MYISCRNIHISLNQRVGLARCFTKPLTVQTTCQVCTCQLYMVTNRFFSTVFLHVTSITHMHVSAGGIYCIAGYFHGVLIFVIFMVHLGVTKFSTHEICVVLSTRAQI